MLSVLIPTYNYDVSPLVTAIQKEANTLKINYEIIVLEDGSNEHITTNFNCKNIKVIVLQNNVGRILARQKLAETAQFDWLLFLDADVLPKSKNYIKDYIKHLSSTINCITGGIAYKQETPNKNHILRWKYGKTKEEVPAKIRNKKPYKSVSFGNFAIQKELFLLLNKKISSNLYGEDNHFGALLKTNNYKVLHINNEVYHLGIDKNIDYIKKNEDATLSLLSLYKKRKQLKSDNDLLNTFILIKKIRLDSIFSFIYSVFKTPITNNLISNKPSINLLQLYKLAFMCYSESKTN